MSPLARIGQVAARTGIFSFLATAALAAGTSPPPRGAPVAAADPLVVLSPKAAGQIAHSSLLTVEGAVTNDALRLSIRRAQDKSLITSGEITVTVDGKNEPVTHENAGAFEIPVNDVRGDGTPESARDVEIIVPHDGLREILSSKVSVTETSSGAGSLLGDHKQMAWWILNIVIVLIAAMAISRRKG
jgi:hypothetical protein